MMFPLRKHTHIHTYTHTYTHTFSQEERVYTNDQSRKGIVVESYMVVSTHYLGENVFCEKNINAVHKRKLNLKLSMVDLIYSCSLIDNS